MHHLITSTKYPKNGMHGIHFYINQGLTIKAKRSFQASTLFAWKWSRKVHISILYLSHICVSKSLSLLYPTLTTSYTHTLSRFILFEVCRISVTILKTTSVNRADMKILQISLISYIGLKSFYNRIRVEVGLWVFEAKMLQIRVIFLLSQGTTIGCYKSWENLEPIKMHCFWVEQWLFYEVLSWQL